MNLRIRRFAAALGAVAAASVALSLAAGVPSAAKKPKQEARFLHPKYADFQVRTIAVLPLATPSQDEDADKITRRSMERALSGTGYRFLTTGSFISAAKAAGLEAEARALETQWRGRGSLDTTALRSIGRATIADAVLAVQATTWERFLIDYNVSGQSFTQITWAMSLYSTKTGERLWANVFSDKGEGPYNNATGGENVTGVQGGGGLRPQARTSTSLDPPTFEEVAAKLEPKVKSGFPPIPAASAGAASAAPAGAESTSAKK
jgi:hypothetical protein